jgi:tetratricopeptide (TPR) repeat protein
VVRPNQNLSLQQLLDELDTGGNSTGLIPENKLYSIWKTLLDRDQIVLRTMAETVRPETESQIADYVRGQLNYNKASKAIKALRSLNLIVVKPRIDGEDLLELHPIVRRFVRGTFPHSERLSFINCIRKAYRDLMAQFRPALQKQPTLSALQHWTQYAELDIEAGSVTDALATLAEVSHLLSSSAYPREFCRVARVVVAKVNWENDYSKVRNFDTLIERYTETLSYLGESSQAEEILNNYSSNIKNKDARYIQYCGMRCHHYWAIGDYAKALEWGRAGRDLKLSSDVDIAYQIEHPLALAERDSGRPELALTVFLGGRSMDEVTDPSEFDPARGGPHYGNIGRCLQFMGQLESALICYKKSALAIEKSSRGEHFRNQGFIRMWIGEVLAAESDFQNAAIFFAAARAKWSRVSPPRVRMVEALEKQLRERLGGWQFDESSAESICLKWIFDRGGADTGGQIAHSKDA